MPIITWEPDNHLYEARPQPLYSLANIASGRFDTYIRSVAVAAANYRHRFMIRFGEEMNGGWYPWGVGVDGNTPEEFVSAWRHIVSIFRTEGASNVLWVWSPNIVPGGRAFAQFYPGDQWVDWVGLDGYNDGRPWTSPIATFGASYDELARITKKPMMIAETASATVPGYKTKADWIEHLFGKALPTRMPLVRAVVWFDMDRGRADWRLEHSPRALQAFGAALRHGAPLL
jgi:beta-mannanase